MRFSSDHIGPIQGTNQAYLPEDTKAMIEPLRGAIAKGRYDGGAMLEYPLVTRTFGLRDKVKELLDNEIQTHKELKTPETSGKKENVPEDLEDRLKACRTFEELGGVLRDTIPNAQKYKEGIDLINNVREGYRSIYSLTERSKFQI